MAFVRAALLWLGGWCEWIVTLTAVAVALETARLELLQRYCQRPRSGRILGEARNCDGRRRDA